jgi:hypothetical protein
LVKRVFYALVAVLALGAVAATSARPAERGTPSRLTSARSFAFAIGSGDLRGNLAQRYTPFDIVIVDGGGVSKAQVAAIHSAHKALVLGYLSVGTIERGRSWYQAAKPFRLGYWSDWGEWYADVNAPGFRTLMVKKVATAMLAKGLDGLFLDNTDMTETHPGRVKGMHLLVAALSKLSRTRGKLLFAQNGAGVNWPLRSFYNGMNFEDVSFSYDFAKKTYVAQSASAVAQAQRNLRRYSAAGLKVTATDYLPAGDAADTALALANTCAAGALPYVSNIGLTRVPAQAFVCPSS